MKEDIQKSNLDQDEQWMRLALEQADKAAQLGEVPVGAVIVLDERLIASGFNQPISRSDPTAHAEIQALRQACLVQENYRIPHSTLYVTIEPCTMCIGAIIHARVGRLVFGAREPKAGAVCSHSHILAGSHLNHQVDVVESVLEEDCRLKIQAFFRAKRLAK